MKEITIIQTVEITDVYRVSDDAQYNPADIVKPVMEDGYKRLLLCDDAKVLNIQFFEMEVKDD